MTSCKDVYGFLSQIGARNITTAASDADQALLQQLRLVQFVTADQYKELESNVDALDAAQQAIAQESAQRAGLSIDAESEEQKTHSVLFHFEGKQKQAAALQQAAQSEAQLKALDDDLTRKQQAFAELVAQRSLRDTLTPCGDRYVGFTGLGVVETRNLGFALYRVSDSDFSAYWNQEQRITQELTDLATNGATYFPRLAAGIAGADPSQLWAISIGLAKSQPDPGQGWPPFAEAYEKVAPLSPNLENRLMSTEILMAKPGPIENAIPTLAQIQRDVRNLDVPSQSSLGVASILLLGQRADGTIATSNLSQYLQVTKSYESAALMAIVNLPFEELGTKFQSLRALFNGWGYAPSEDVELSSAYLAVSELPIEGMSTKLGIISRGLSTYLQFPLVASAVLAALAALEANETLNLLGRAYDIIGRRAAGLTQAELICLAVRMLHGIRDELVRPLDATAAVPPAARAATGAYGPVYGPRFFFVPIIVAHNAYFATYSGVSGAHPGHIHGVGGGAGGLAG